MAQTFDQNPLDHDLGFSTGIGLAVLDAFLNEQAVLTIAQEYFDHSPLQKYLDRWQFVTGVVKGFEMYRDGFV